MIALSVDFRFCQALTAALIHSLWQVTALAVCGAALTRILRNNGSSLRYGILLTLQLGSVALFLLTFASCYWPQGNAVSALPISSSAPATSNAGGAMQDDSNSPAQSLRGNVHDSQPYNLTQAVSVCYFIGVAAMLVRLIFGLWGGKRMIRASSPITQGHVLVAIGKAVKAMEFQYTPAIAYCNSVVVPSVVGIVRPTLLLPFTVLSGLTPQQLQVLVMHELAHIRRYDHLWNMLQRIIESLFFFNPAIWYLSYRIRAEREICCDDCVVACGGQAERYANSLLRMAEISVADPLSGVALVSLAATGRRSDLRHRVIRLIEDEAVPPLRLRSIGALFVTIAITIGVVAPVAFAMRSTRSAGETSVASTPPPPTSKRQSDYRKIAPASWPDLHAAAAYGNPEEVFSILRQGVDVNLRDSANWTPLHYATALNRLETMKVLLSAHADPNALGPMNRPPLHAALGLGPRVNGGAQNPVNLATLQLLFSRGANPNIAAETGFTTLHQAVSRRDVAIVRTVLDHGGDLRALNADGRDSLQLAAGLSPPNPDIVELLLSRGANANAIDAKGWSNLDSLCFQEHDVNETSIADFNRAAQALLKAGVVPEPASMVILGMTDKLRPILSIDPGIVNRPMVKTKERNALIHWAAKYAPNHTIRALAEAGADLTAVNSGHESPLFLAAYRRTNARDAVQLLLELGCEVNPTNPDALPALFAAVARHDPTVVRMLLASGAKADAVSSGSTLLHRIALAERVDPGANHLTNAEAVLKAGAKINLRDNNGNTPLHIAVAASRGDLARLYLENGADANDRDRSGRTPLLMAVVAHPPAIGIVRDLLRHGADVGVRDSAGRDVKTILMSSGDAEAVSVARQLK